ncbi:Hypothetical_protein [Hexamita inflata]|uniref:Hypothetical_protein n=1 Tax=Hexamita inflata TaxID=28002 RepID=A0AA86Q596_9EUKA|nr:Hypothetical protein HINF_LOCUS33714 [Hexamita inflata]
MSIVAQGTSLELKQKYGSGYTLTIIGKGKRKLQAFERLVERNDIPVLQKLLVAQFISDILGEVVIFALIIYITIYITIIYNFEQPKLMVKRRINRNKRQVQTSNNIIKISNAVKLKQSRLLLFQAFHLE